MGHVDDIHLLGPVEERVNAPTRPTLIGPERPLELL